MGRLFCKGMNLGRDDGRPFGKNKEATLNAAGTLARFDQEDVRVKDIIHYVAMQKN
jgi:hypothetical protein